MNTLTRWNPFREMMELRDEMDRIFENNFNTPRLRRHVRTSWGPALDLIESDNEFIVRVSVPGINPDALDVTLVDNVLTIKGERAYEEPEEEEVFHLRELSYGTFSRSITLPVSVDADDVEANYEHGILTLHVPKAEEVKPKRIQVSGQGDGQKALEGELV